MEFMVGELGDGLQHQEMLYNDHKTKKPHILPTEQQCIRTP